MKIKQVIYISLVCICLGCVLVEAISPLIDMYALEQGPETEAEKYEKEIEEELKKEDFIERWSYMQVVVDYHHILNASTLPLIDDHIPCIIKPPPDHA